MNVTVAKSLGARTASHHSPDVRKAASTVSDFDSAPNSGYIRQAELLANVLPFSSATLWRKVKAGEFVAPTKLSARVTAWNIGQVRQWLQVQSAV